MKKKLLILTAIATFALCLCSCEKEKVKTCTCKTETWTERYSYSNYETDISNYNSSVTFVDVKDRDYCSSLDIDQSQYLSDYPYNYTYHCKVTCH